MGSICCSSNPNEEMNLILNEIKKKNFKLAKSLTNQQLIIYKDKPKTVNFFQNIDSVIRALQARSSVNNQVKYFQSNLNKQKTNLNSNKQSFQISDQSFVDESAKIYKNIENILLTFRKYIKDNKAKNPSSNRSTKFINNDFEQQLERQKNLHQKYELLIKQLPYNDKNSVEELKLQVRKLLRQDFQQFYQLTKSFIEKYGEYQLQVKRLKDIEKKLKDSQQALDKNQDKIISVSRTPSEIEMQNTLNKPKKQQQKIQQNKNALTLIKKQQYQKLKETYEQQKKKLQKSIVDLQKEKRTLQINFQRKQQKCNGYMIQVEGLIQYSYKLQIQQKKIQTQYKELLTQNSSIKSEKQNLKKQIDQNKQLNRQKLQQLQKQKEKQIQQKQKIITKLQDQKKEIKNNHSKQIQLILLKNKIVQEQSQSRNTLTDNEQQEEKQNLRIMAFFQGDILFNKANQKRWMMYQIQNLVQAKIRRTRMLYKLDVLSNVNFHQYIDGHRNILLIVQLKNGYILAGFSTIPFIKSQTNTNYSGEGLIMSLTNEQSFKLKTDGQKIRPITYDEYYLIYGNSQLRLRFKEEMFFSNFGILNSYYNANGKKVEVLLNYGKEREIALNNYQIYEIIF